MLVKKDAAMSQAITFDTLGYFERLKAAGMPEAQARVQAEALREIIEDKLATKKDLLDLEFRMDGKLREMEYRLTIRLGGMLAAAVAVLAVLIKIL
jgi:hypothetical protein